MQSMQQLKTLPDDELLRRLAALLHDSRHAEADLVAHIAEVDARRLYAREAAPSMFQYCTERLHLSEAEAYLRIAAARASREHPIVLTMLADGRLHLTAIAMLAPHLAPQNRDALLQRATHKTKREIEDLLAELHPRPDAPALIRKLPDRGPIEPRPSGPPSAGSGQDVSPGLELRPDVVLSDSSSAPVASDLEARPDAVGVLGPEPSSEEPGRRHVELRPVEIRAHSSAVIESLAPARYKVQFTASAELRDKLERLQALMRSSVPDGDLAAIIDAAVTEKLERLESRRFARTKAPRKALAATDTSPTSRHVPAAVRRVVHDRDEGRCRYVDEKGRRCTARAGLEFHHRHPFGLGGDHSRASISLLCPTHNRHLAEVDYGREAMARHRRPSAPPGSS